MFWVLTNVDMHSRGKFNLEKYEQIEMIFKSLKYLMIFMAIACIQQLEQCHEYKQFLLNSISVNFGYSNLVIMKFWLCPKGNFWQFQKQYFFATQKCNYWNIDI